MAKDSNYCKCKVPKEATKEEMLYLMGGIVTDIRLCKICGKEIKKEK